MCGEDSVLRFLSSRGRLGCGFYRIHLCSFWGRSKCKSSKSKRATRCQPCFGQLCHPRKSPFWVPPAFWIWPENPPGCFFFFFLSGMKFYPHLKDTGSSGDGCICRSSEVDSGPAEADIPSSWTWAHSHGTNLSNTQQAAAAWATLGV